MKNYSSVIVTFNRKELLKQSLESVLNQTVSPKSVVVLDNHSTDGTDEFMEQYQSNDKVIYLRTKSNVGGSMGFYLGLTAAYNDGADWISLSDDDAVFDKDYFEKLLLASEENPELLCLTGSVKSMDGSIQEINRRRIVNSATLKEQPVSSSEYQRNFYFDSFTFVGVLLNRHLIEKIGFPEKDYFIWNDDAEYAIRAAKVTKILNVSTATVVHHNQLGSKKVKFQPSWKEYYGIRNRVQMELKHSTNKKALVGSNLYTIARKTGSVLLKPVKWRYAPYILGSIIAGYRDGLSGKTGKNMKYLP